ncbi:MAG: iron ABC transporter permease [Peptococcaceae bacterium 1109]|nr:MAG: iron ABC transporter permease [Peptococcaceae bacterium 1109]
MSDRKKLVALACAAAALAVLLVGWGLNSFIFRYALSRRLPRLLAMLLTGSAVACSTVVFQTITHNRILTPSIMGLDALYLFLQTAVVFAFGVQSAFVVNGLLSFLLSTGLMVGFTLLIFGRLFRAQEGGRLFHLLLVGVILGTLLDSSASFMQMVIDPNEFQTVQNRMFASFNNIQVNILVPGGIILLGAMAYIVRQVSVLDVLALGRDHAVSLGIPYEQATGKYLIAVAIMVAVATSLVGPITFLGLLVANLAREAMNTCEHRLVLPAAALMGIIALVGGQLVAEHVLSLATPISVIINFIGGVYFIGLLLRARTVH